MANFISAKQKTKKCPNFYSNFKPSGLCLSLLPPYSPQTTRSNSPKSLLSYPHTQTSCTHTHRYHAHTHTQRSRTHTYHTQSHDLRNLGFQIWGFWSIFEIWILLWVVHVFCIDGLFCVFVQGWEFSINLHLFISSNTLINISLDFDDYQSQSLCRTLIIHTVSNQSNQLIPTVRIFSSTF